MEKWVVFLDSFSFGSRKKKFLLQNKNKNKKELFIIKQIIMKNL